MAYLKNSAVNLLNLHYGLHALAMNGAGVFWAVYLLKAGVPTPAVFGSLALLLAGRFLFRPTILLLAPRFGLRALVAFGTVFSALQYLFLAEVRGVDLMLARGLRRGRDRRYVLLDLLSRLFRVARRQRASRQADRRRARRSPL